MKQFANFVIIVSITASALADAPYIDPTKDHLYFGDPQKILFWGPKQKVAGFRNTKLIFPVGRVAKSTQVLALSKAITNLGNVAIEYAENPRTISDYFSEFNVAGLLVIKDGVIVYERYALGNSQETHWNSFSVTKSITSLLLGAAIKDGYINSVEDGVADYLPALKGSAYENVTLRDVLQMTSGVAWNEDYADPESDINKIDWSSREFYRHLQNTKSIAEPGRIFNYSTAETHLVGEIVRSATGRTLSQYLSEKIWQPFGMEHDAHWQLTAPGEGEFGGSSLSATLHDYARLGLFALSDGVLPNGESVLAENWMEESVTASLVNPRYGYQWWLGKDSVFEASGIFGQSIYVDPENAIVIAQHSVRNEASDERDWATQAAAFRAIAHAIGK